MVDFHLAMRINNINVDEYQLFNINNEQEYKKEYNKIRMKRDSERIQKMLDEDSENWKKQHRNEQVK